MHFQPSYTDDNPPLLCWIPREKIEGVELELHYQPLPPAVDQDQHQVDADEDEPMVIDHGVKFANG